MKLEEFCKMFDVNACIVNEEVRCCGSRDLLNVYERIEGLIGEDFEGCVVRFEGKNYAVFKLDDRILISEVRGEPGVFYYKVKRLLDRIRG